MSPTRADGLRPGPSATLPRFATAKAACRRAYPCVRHPGQALPSSARATSFSTAVALSSVLLMCLCAAHSSTWTHAEGRGEQDLSHSPSTSHTSLVVCARAHALDCCRAILWLKRLLEQRLDHTSSAGCRVGHGLAVHGRRDPRCIIKQSCPIYSRNEPVCVLLFSGP